MAQPQPKSSALSHVLKLAYQLTPNDQEQLVEQIKLQWLRRELTKAEESIEQGEGIPGEVVLAELRQRAEDRLKKNQQ